MLKELVFYTNPQSRGRIVHWMLEEIGAPYAIEVKDYGTTMRRPIISPSIPWARCAIRYGEVVVTERRPSAPISPTHFRRWETAIARSFYNKAPDSGRRCRTDPKN